jgi:hypothetical protein
VLDLIPISAALIRCFSEPARLDAFPVVDGAAVCRVAPDEAIVIGPRERAEELLAHVAANIGSDPNSLAIPLTDAWSFWALQGEQASEAFRRVSTNALPTVVPALIQGAIAQLQGKTLVLANYIVLMVPSSVGHHVPERIVAACPDLNPRLAEAQPFAIAGGIRLLTARPTEVVAL